MTSDNSALLLWIVVLLIAIVILGILNIQQMRQRKAEERENEEEEERKNRRIFTYYIPKFKAALREANSLREVYSVHLKIWGAGIRPANIGPDKYGMYRTDDILTMTMQEIFLGDICGLNTNTAVYWEKLSESHPMEYSQVLCQYKSQLLSNLEAYRAR